MYEKCQEYDRALSDISVVLAIDKKHVKARLRRARILENQVRTHLPWIRSSSLTRLLSFTCLLLMTWQGQLRSALKDYVFCQTVERIQSGEPPAYTSRVEEISRIIAAEDGASAMRTIRESRK